MASPLSWLPEQSPCLPELDQTIRWVIGKTGTPITLNPRGRMARSRNEIHGPFGRCLLMPCYLRSTSGNARSCRPSPSKWFLLSVPWRGSFEEE